MRIHPMLISFALLAIVSLTLPTVHAAASDTAPFGFTNSKWIWSSEMAAGTAPVGAVRTFRKAFMAPEGKTPISAHIFSASDDNQVFFINGRQVITGTFGVPRAVCVGLNPCLNVFAVKVDNAGGGPAGFLAAIRVTYSDGTTSMLGTDPSWRVDNGATTGFETLSFDDSVWATSYVTGNYDRAPSTITSTLTATLDPENVKCEGLKTTTCKCGTVCDAPSPGSETVKSEFECSADAENPEYLSAVPGEGCVLAKGDDDAEQMCSDRTDNAGNRDIKCFVQCSAGFVAKDQNTCVKPGALDQSSGGAGGTCCEVDAAKRDAREAEERQAREEERQEREEAKRARAEEKQEREEAKQARAEEKKAREECPCPCPKPPTVPTVKDAPAVADDAMQDFIDKKMKELGIPPCPAKLKYVKTANGYQCTGGGHKISFAQLVILNVNVNVASARNSIGRSHAAIV
ncbi:hypothetical protein C8R47DRAFT_1076176 [Mycena vitilis]|nr:hypothetical protein C8R47DRAFT_1076176 [Mycena vitilis]